MTLEPTFQDFFRRHYQGGKPLLLGLSGGPDSLALFHLLIKYRIPFGVAHVDHGWRAESGQEALILRDLVNQYQLPYHEKKLKGAHSELICREERLKFFKECFEKEGYEALLLGHQRDDQVETVLKRILEGATLINLKGMGETSSINAIPVWRPLITIEKRKILKWLEEQNLKPFFDYTNEDPKYLRSRMRQQILPNLAASFGKEIHPSLIHLGEEAKELHFFLNKHLEPILLSVKYSPFGYFLDLTPHPPMTPFELKYLIRSFCKMGGFTPSRDLVNRASQMVLKRSSNKVLISGKNYFYIDKNRLLLKARWNSIDNESFM